MFSLGCSRSLAIDPRDFACSSDSECGEGTVCVLGRCGDRETPDVGVEPIRYLEIATSSRYYCAVREDGFVDCDGYGIWGQLDPPNLEPVHGIDAGNRHACAIADADDRMICWGDASEINNAHVPPVDLGPVKQVSAAANHTCALKMDGTVRCWGWINADRTFTSTSSGFEVAEIATGRGHTCYRLPSNEVTCFGHPQRITPPPGELVRIDAGYDHTCGIRASGAIECWGSDEPAVLRTVAPDDAVGFLEVAGGYDHSCAVRTDHLVRCFGRPRDEFDVGQDDPPPGRFLHLAASVYFTCGIREDRTIACWGDVHHE